MPRTSEAKRTATVLALGLNDNGPNANLRRMRGDELATEEQRARYHIRQARHGAATRELQAQFEDAAKRSRIRLAAIDFVQGERFNGKIRPTSLAGLDLIERIAYLNGWVRHQNPDDGENTVEYRRKSRTDGRATEYIRFSLTMSNAINWVVWSPRLDGLGARSPRAGKRDWLYRKLTGEP